MYVYLTVIALVTLFICFLKQRNKKFLKNIPVPPGNLLFGHALELQSTTNLLKAFSKFTREHGNTVKLRVGHIDGLLTTDYKLTEFLLSGTKILKKSLNYLLLVPWLGPNSLLLAYGRKWQHHRKILTPAFHFGILKGFVDTFETVGEVLVKKLEETPSVDVYPLVTLCTLDAICESAMGVKINAQEDQNSVYASSVKEMCQIVTNKCLSPWKLIPFIYRWSKDYAHEVEVLKTLKNFSTRVINTKKQERKQQTVQENRKQALLNLLIKFSNEGQMLKDEEIQDQVNTFMFAGHDTTASGISFALYCLANHSEVQERVLREQQDLFGGEKNPKITFDDLQNMTYLDHVIKETLRLYPPVPMIGRRTCNEMEIDDDCVIPSGTNMAIYIYEIHRNPQVFLEPEKFDPDRFDSFDSSRPFAYIPFSAGARNCIGKKFAMLEMKSVISKIVRHFELLPANPKHEMVLAAETVLKSANGIKVGLKKRAF